MRIIALFSIILLIVGGMILIPEVSGLQDSGEALGGNIAGVYGLTSGVMIAVVGTLAFGSLVAALLFIFKALR